MYAIGGEEPLTVTLWQGGTISNYLLPPHAQKTTEAVEKTMDNNEDLEEENIKIIGRVVVYTVVL